MNDLTRAGYRSVIVGVLCIVISTISVVLRYVCKSMVQSGYHIDDVWILFTLLSYYGAAGANIWGIITGGGGREVTEMLMVNPSPESLRLSERYMVTRFIAFTISLVAVFAVKMSLLSFYQRIFDTKVHRIASLITMGLSVAWITGTMIANFLVCKPLQKFWQPLLPGECANYSVYFLLSGGLETFIDVIILVLPVRTVMQLNLPIRNKIVLSSIFMLGIIAVATNIVRIKLIYQPAQMLIDFGPAEVWTNIHLGVSIVCACAVTYKPLWGAVTNFFGRLRTSRAMSDASFGHTRGLDSNMSAVHLTAPESTWKEMSTTTLATMPSSDSLRKEAFSSPPSRYSTPNSFSKEIGITSKRNSPNIHKQLPQIRVPEPQDSFETQGGPPVTIERPRLPRTPTRGRSPASVSRASQPLPVQPPLRMPSPASYSRTMQHM